MAQEKQNPNNLSWEQSLLATLLFPFLLLDNFTEEYKKELEEQEKASEDKKVPAELEKEKKESAMQQAIKDSCHEAVTEDKKEHEDNITAAKDADLCENKQGDADNTCLDPIIQEFVDVDPDEFICGLVENNSHEDYYDLAEFVKDALIDLHNGTDECGWVYQPNDKPTVELKLNEYVDVNDTTATLLNHTLGHLPFTVRIEKRQPLGKGNHEYVLVLEL